MEERQPVARVTRIGIGRLFNLGHYEHIRYDLTIEIPEGADVLECVSKLRQILRALKPRKAETRSMVERAKTLLAKTPEERAVLIEKRGYSDEDFEKALTLVERATANDVRRDAALLLFNNLGGESVYTDHKQNWDDGDWDDNDG